MEYITLLGKEDGFKIPKNFIKYDVAAQQAVNVSELNCTVLLDYTYGGKNCLKVVGEIFSDELSSNILIYVMIYNKENTLIGCDFDEVIRKGSFNSFTSFSTDLRIPEGETISKIVIRPGINPVSA